jgi:hypothetical protein
MFSFLDKRKQENARREQDPSQGSVGNLNNVRLETSRNFGKKKELLNVKIEALENNLLTYLLTPWSRVFLEKLKVNFAASQEFPRIYGTRKFLTVPTRARHLSLS